MSKLDSIVLETAEQWRTDGGPLSQWVIVPGIYCGAYGADANTANLVAANWEVFTDLAAGLEVNVDSFAGGESGVEIVDDEGFIVEGAEDFARECIQALEEYCFLHGADDIYSELCFEQAVESIEDALQDTLPHRRAGDARADLEDRCEALGFEAIGIARMLLEEGELEWHEEECWACFYDDVPAMIAEVCEAVEGDNRKAAAMATRCDRTPDMFQ
jgi:hypothetical protein